MREFLHYYSVVSLEDENGEEQFYLYNADSDVLIPFFLADIPSPEPDPEPDPEPEPFIFDMRVALIDPNTGEPVWMITDDRFDILTGQTDGNDLVFHVKTLKDKMSMQGGVLFIVPYNMTITPQTTVSSTVQITAPRKEDMIPESAEVSWELNSYSGKWGLVVTIGNDEMYGLDNSSADIPWNWYYGFEFQGRIPLILE